MAKSQRFPYQYAFSAYGRIISRPILPVTLIGKDGLTTEVSGLIDSGADINILPYRLGVELGFIWDEQPELESISGNLARFSGRGCIVNAKVGDFEIVRLAFAWLRTNDVSVIFGQVNFFQQFDICFFQTQSAFELRPTSQD